MLAPVYRLIESALELDQTLSREFSEGIRVLLDGNAPHGPTIAPGRHRSGDKPMATAEDEKGTWANVGPTGGKAGWRRS